MKSAELRLDRLLGRPVIAGNNKSIGRLEEFRAERHGRGCVITGWVIGGAALMERLGLLGRGLLFGPRPHGYLARWDQIDFSNPDKPRLTCPVEELQRL